ncbi:MAG: transcriptional regulator, partial [Acidobacteria bacterium]|nr:transcriptional regulator [Acidobacteriota bacterium]
MSSRPKHLYEFGPFVLNPAEHTLLRDGQPLPLRPKVFDLLLVLVERHNHLIEKDELMSAVWPEQYVEEGNLNKTVSLLRLALGESVDGVRYIETVPKRGYRFAADVRKVCDNGDPELVVETHTRASLVVEEETDESAPAADGGARVGEADVAEPTKMPSTSARPAGIAERRFKGKQAHALALS